MTGLHQPRPIPRPQGPGALHLNTSAREKKETMANRKAFIYLFILIFLKNKFIYLFIYFWLLWVFADVRGLSLVAASQGHFSLWCTGLSLRWLLFVAEHGL